MGNFVWEKTSEDMKATRVKSLGITQTVQDIIERLDVLLAAIRTDIDYLLKEVDKHIHTPVD